jgi:hypothetical protein
MQVPSDRVHRTSGATPNRLPAPSFFKNKKGQKLKRGKSHFQAFSFIVAKIALGAFLLSFMSIYQPTLDFPLFKINTVQAQEPSQQTQTISTSPAPIIFQLPHPGYLSTPFSRYHPGIDIASGLGMPIKPIAGGVVIDAGFNFWGLGLIVEVEHASGFRSLYAHLGKIYVTKGQEVDATASIGEVGLTGRTSGPHTHIELAKDGHKIDPRPLLPEIANYPTEEYYAAKTPQSTQIPSTVPIPASASAQLRVDNDYIIDEATPSALFINLLTPLPTPSPTPEPTRKPLTQTIYQKQVALNKLKSIVTVTKTQLTPPTQISHTLPTFGPKFVTSSKVIPKSPPPVVSESNIKSVLSLKSPAPSSSPIPQGGPVKFSLSAFLNID